MKFRGKGINLQVLVECCCYLLFGIQLFHLTFSGAYLHYVTPRMKPYLYGMSILMILFAVVEGRRLLMPQYRVKLYRSFVFIFPILLLSFRPAVPSGSSMIRTGVGSPVANRGSFGPGLNGNNDLGPKLNTGSTSGQNVLGGSGQNGTGQESLGQDGAGQGGSGQNGTGQGGLGQDGTGQGGSGQNGVGQGGSGQNGTGQGGSGQNGTGQSGSGQNGVGQSGSVQNETGLSGSVQNGAGQSGSVQNGMNQNDLTQGSSNQATNQTTTGQAGSGQSTQADAPTNSAPINTTSSQDQQQDGPEYQLYGLDQKTKTVTVADDDFYTWLYELSEHPQKYIGYTIIMKGFIYQDPDVKKEGDFALVRLSMWCCAADLTPIGFVVDDGGKMKFKVDDWVTVKGTFEMTKDGSTQMLRAQDIKAAPKPKEEYVYPSF